MKECIRVLIADDHPLFRKGLRGLIESVTGMEVVGEAIEGEEAILLTERLHPDVVLMDIHMPGVNGIEATSRILHLSPSVGILILTMHGDDDSVFAAMRAGARGYLLKGVDQVEVLRAIHAVSSGEAIFSPSIAQRLIHYFATLTNTITPIFPELTDREREILAQIARGHTNAAIAEKLVLSPKTVRNHVSNIFSKLQVAGRAEAIIRARNAGLT